jgi:hypothetical protein
LVDPNTVNRLVKEICVSSEGTLSEDEFDSQLKSFLSILPQDVLNAALLSIKKQASKAPPARKGPYFMGIVKKVSKQHWERSDSRNKNTQDGQI